jgi:predicted MFS family arabinose efflux permease
MAGIVAAVIAVLVLLALFIAKPILEEPPPRVGDGRTAVGKATFAFLGFPVVWLAFGFFLLVTAAFGGLQSFSAPILGDLYGLTPAVAVAALTAYLLGAAGGTLAGGFVAGRVAQHDRLVARSLAIAAAFAVILAAGVLPPWAVMPLMVCIGLGVGLAGPSRDLLVRRAAIETASAGAAAGSGANSPAFGRIYGFVYSGLDVGLAVGPLVFGVLLDAGGKAYVLPGIALLQILAVLTVLNMGRRMRPVAVA